MTGLIFGQNFDCVSGEISAAFPFLCLQRRRMGLNFSFEGFFTLLNTLALAARVVVVLEQCPFIADFFALAAFQVHQKKIFSSDLSLVKNIHVYLDKDRTGRDGDISWTMTSRGHYFSKWVTFRGHSQRVTFRGHFW